ncbi:hypothetical protein PR001_g32809, partial [Phytophthora rubi]
MHLLAELASSPAEVGVMAVRPTGAAWTVPPTLTGLIATGRVSPRISSPGGSRSRVLTGTARASPVRRSLRLGCHSSVDVIGARLGRRLGCGVPVASVARGIIEVCLVTGATLIEGCSEVLNTGIGQGDSTFTILTAAFTTVFTSVTLVVT